MYKRMIFKEIIRRLKEPESPMQVLMGPRQVGKTTVALQVMEASGMPTHYASADEPTLQNIAWIEAAWLAARAQARSGKTSLLILDELQKIPEWSSCVKRLWDEDKRKKYPVKVLLLGSSPLLLQTGLTESLAGRFELIPILHWSYEEMREAFDFTLDQYIYFGGYPGAASLIGDEKRWRAYIQDSLIETTLSRDILLMTRIDKPALLRRLFHLGCEYSGQILSYQKMQGQLQDAGNTTTLAHYLQLLENIGMLLGLQKYAGQVIRKRGSSPKLQVFNTALMSALSPYDFATTHSDREKWGRWIESCVGAHLVNQARAHHANIYYWREQDQEVDFVVEYENKLLAIEVKSSAKQVATSGMNAFISTFHPDRALIIGARETSLESFLLSSLADWL